MNLDSIGPAPCSACKRVLPPSELIFQGEDLEPICRECLHKLDPERADILARIQGLRKPG